jgi:hypothetical protein
MTRRRQIDADDLITIIGGKCAGEAGSEVSGDPSDQHDPCHGFGEAGLFAGASPLDASALEQFAVLFLCHPLAALLDNRTHVCDLSLPAIDRPDIRLRCGVTTFASQVRHVTRATLRHASSLMPFQGR